MHKLKLFNSISQKGLDTLPADRFVISEDSADGILLRSADLHSLEFSSELKAIARAGAGVNNIPIDRCSESGIVVFNTPGANANAVKELAICSLFLASRDIADAIAWCNTLKNKPDVATLVEKNKSKFAGCEIAGKTLGVIGLGAIGIAVANTAYTLGMEVYGYDPYLSVDAAWTLSRHINKAPDLKTICKNCDYISIHVPLNAATKDMLNASLFSEMKQGVRIINLARGGLVNTNDILAALENGTVAKYVTDFPDADLIGVPNVISIPHLGASTEESEVNCAIMACQQIADYLETGCIKNSVNLPDTYLPISTPVRLCIIHQNIPNMLSRITQTLSDDGINIENLSNRSKKTYAYTIVDIMERPNGRAMAHIATIDGVIRTRIIDNLL